MTTKGEQFTFDKDSVLVTRPTYIIEVMMSIAAFLFGLYVSSPLFKTSLDDPEPNTFSTNFWIRFVTSCVFFFFPAAISFTSIFVWRLRANKWRRRATFTQYLAWFFIALLQILNSGFYPVNWVFTLTLGAIAAVCHFSTRVTMKAESDARRQ